MNISRKLQINTLLTIGVSLTCALLIGFSYLQIIQIGKSVSVESKIIQEVFELNILTSNYITSPYPRTVDQWLNKTRNLQAMFESLSGKQTAVSTYVDDARGAVQRMHDIFVALTRIPLSEDLRVKNDSDKGLQRRLINKLMIHAQYLAEACFRINTEIQTNHLSSLKHLGVILVAMLVITIGIVVYTSQFLGRRTTKRIAQLQKGAAVIGEGNLTYRFDIGSRNDELESLASTFNQMAASILHREKQLEHINEALRKKRKKEKEAADLIARSEKQYRDLVETANSIIIRWDNQGMIRFINSYGCRFFGYSQEELVGQDVMTIVPNVERSSGRDLAHLVRDIVVNPSLYTNVSSENIKKSGDTVWVTWTNKAVFDESGKINEILAIGNDISRLKQTEAELEALNENLEGVVAERTALAQKRLTQLQALTQELIKAEENERRRLSDLLHEDIQQLLVSTRIHMETACHRGPANHGMEDALKILTKSIKKLKNLSRELSPPVLNHASLSSALEWLVNETEEQYGLSVVLNINTQLKAGEKQINTFLFRTVQELLFNIIKHAGVNEACIDLDPSHGGFTITVTDKGRGFDCEAWANVSAGNGFGLLRINERAQSLGVTVSIESNQGRGSKIKLTVPDEIYFEQPRQHIANSRTI
nr:PAS domain S-box protein [uncultured Desulfobacter sp.]